MLRFFGFGKGPKKAKEPELATIPNDNMPTTPPKINPLKQCAECGITYDSENENARKIHTGHKFTKCPVCRHAYDASNLEEHEKHQNEKICQTCTGIYNVKDQQEVLKHISEEICNICSRMYDKRYEPDHEATTHPTQKYCLKCQTVTSTTNFSINHSKCTQKKEVSSTLDIQYDLKPGVNNPSASNPTIQETPPLPLGPPPELPPKPPTDRDVWQQISRSNVPTLPTPPPNYGHEQERELHQGRRGGGYWNQIPPTPQVQVAANYKVDTNIDETSHLKKVDTEALWTKLAKFFKDGMPICEKYIKYNEEHQTKAIPPTNNVSNPTTTTRISNGEIVRTTTPTSNPAYIPTPASTATVTDCYSLQDKFPLRTKIVIPAALTDSGKHPQYMEYNINVNGYAQVKKVIERVIKKFDIDTEIYKIKIVIKGKELKDFEKSICSVIDTVETLVHIIIMRPIPSEPKEEHKPMYPVHPPIA